MIYSWIFFTILLSPLYSSYVQPLYPGWAHDHMVWLNLETQNQSELVKLVEDYQSRGIRVGSVDIDSSWTQCFNSFEWNKQRFPEPEKLIEWLHNKNIKVFIWATSMVNNDCDNYNQGIKNGYFLNGGKLIQWWHGTGAFLDYLNPKAVQWWHRQLDKVLDLGIDGFKCDGTDPMITLLRPWPYSSYKQRFVTLAQYSNHYYGDFFNYTQKKNPQGLIMARPSDSFKIQNPFTNSSYVFLNYAPKYVMFSGWVGDQPSTFEGFKSAVWDVLHSAWNGYLNFGFDIGGYNNKHRTKEVLIRWAQLGAFVPFMENGGLGEHRPWMFGQNIAQIYKKFVDIHYNLKPTFLSYASIAYANGVSVIEPLAKRLSYTLVLKQPSTFGYILCQKLLVFPIFSQNGIAQLKFPSQRDWIYYFDVKKVFPGGLKTLLSFPLDEAPIFYKSNSILALQNQIRVIALEKGTINETIIHEKYTDYVSIDYDGSIFKARIKRYYKGFSQIKSEQIAFKFIGHKLTKTPLETNIDLQENGVFSCSFKTDGETYTLLNLSKSLRQISQ